MLSSIIWIYACLNVYFELLSQALYPIIDAVIQWSTGNEKEMSLAINFQEFSLTYTWLILGIFLFLVVSYGNIQQFIKLNSLGAVVVSFLILFIIYYGFMGLLGTSYVFSNSIIARVNEIKIDFVNTKFAPLAGMLTLGFWLHHVSVPILKSNANKQKNVRDLFFGYLLAWLLFTTVGIFGYIGFSGEVFKNTPGIKRIQNCLNLFPPTHILAFIARVAMFLQVMSAYPVLFHVLELQLSYVISKSGEISGTKRTFINFFMIAFNVVLAAVYPQVGSIIGILGSFLCLNIIYLIPISVYLKRYYLEISHPELVEALDWNKIKTAKQLPNDKTSQNFTYKSPSKKNNLVNQDTGNTCVATKEQKMTQKMLKRRYIQSKLRSKQAKNQVNSQTPKLLFTPDFKENLLIDSGISVKQKFRNFYVSWVLHFLLILVGIAVLAFQFIPL